MTDATRPRNADDARHLLHIYLRDHLAGSAAGLSLVRRSHRSNVGTEFEPVLADIECQIEEDRAALRLMMHRLGVPESRIKQALGVAAELLGRLKSNGRLVHYSPSARVIELESLIGAVAMKRCVWVSLEMIADELDGLDPSELDRLIQRASTQTNRLHEAHERAARLAFRDVDAASTSFRRRSGGVLNRSSISPATGRSFRKETDT
jgi:hypothetical protein